MHARVFWLCVHECDTHLTPSPQFPPSMHAHTCARRHTNLT